MSRPALDIRTPELRADDEELAAIAAEVWPIVDAGNGRSFALRVVRLMLDTFEPQTIVGAVYMRLWTATDQWHRAAVDIDAGEECRLYPGGPPLDLYDVRRYADLLASRAWHRATETPISLASWVLHDTAECLRRACECGSYTIGMTREFVEVSQRHEHTARTLLPLIVRDARNLLRLAGMGTAAIDGLIEEASQP